MVAESEPVSVRAAAQAGEEPAREPAEESEQGGEAMVVPVERA